MSEPDRDSSPVPERETLELLALRYLDGLIEPDELARLNSQLLEHPEDRNRFVNLCTQTAELRETLSARRKVAAGATLNGDTKIGIADELRAIPDSGRRRLIAGLAAAAAVLLAWSLFFRQGTRPELSAPRASVEAPCIATVIQCREARWGDSTSPVVTGERLRAGAFDLPQGLVEIKFSSGATAILQAPSRFELVDGKHAILQSGRIVAHVPKEAIGFVVDTPRMNVVDLGTEFGVETSMSGATSVHVFEGEVVARTRERGSSDAGKSQRLVKGQELDTGAFEGDFLNQSASASDRFIRTFPNDPPAQPGGPLYSKSVQGAVQVMPATSAITIDGDLSEWDRRGAFHAACIEPYDGTYNLDAMLMYDATYLYIGAHVGDPFPMQNRGHRGNEMQFQGGSVILRLSTNKALGWPLQGMAPYYGFHRDAKSDLGRRPQDVSDGIVHLTLWHHQPTDKPRLNLAFGMDFHGIVDDPVGWQGAFRKDPDGKGYTLEYAIPWAALKASQNPPKAGDQLAAVWTVHWSDLQGRICRGYLVDCTNQTIKPYEFMRASTWGKALYQPAP